MQEGAAVGTLVGLLCVLVVWLAIGTVIGAVFLRAAIALYNKMAGGVTSPSNVSEPSFGKSMGITFVTSLVNLVASFVVGIVTGAGAAAAGARGSGVGMLAQAIAIPVSLLIMAAMLTAMLPTKFGRAILVTLCYLLIVVLFAGALGLIAAVVIAFMAR